MQFALMIYHAPEEFAMRKNDYSDPHLGAWRAYYKALVEAGVYVGANALEVPETGTTVRLKEGKRRVQDGPYAETKEQLAGFIILELPSLDAALALLKENSPGANLSTEFPDERLKLLFVCAHPAIDPAMHTPLMLQTVLGLDADRIAHAFLVPPKTMGQRLFRAKTKIRDGGIQFEIPQQRDLPERLDAVLEAIYAAFGISWDDMFGIDPRRRDLAEEAIWLARVLLQLMPSEAEVQGLLALMLHSESRRSARRALDGRYVPLSEQDPKQWSLPLIEEAERHLAEGFKRGRSGRFQLEAAIQSVHAERAHTGRTDWAAIALFYEQLVRISPALGTRVGYAAAVAEAEGPEAGLAVLDPIAPDAVSHYQPYWAVRAHLLQRLGKKREAADAYDRAIGLAEDPAVREFLLQKRG